MERHAIPDNVVSEAGCFVGAPPPSNDEPYINRVLNLNMNRTIRADIKLGIVVNIILKKDQRSGVLTEGVVKNILTSASRHHRGIKVRLEDGQIGRVQEIVDENVG